jgi:transmembrane sensor
MNKEELIALADKILNGEASEAEVGQYNTWYNAMQQREDFDIAEPELKRDAIYARVERIMDSRDHVIEIKKRKLWPRIAAVAAAVTAIALCIYFFNASRLSLKNQDLMNYAENDIAPGKNGATITLADGKVIRLSGEKSGVNVGEALKYPDGSNVQSSVDLQAADGKAQNLIAATGRGQTYQVTLPDGTKVWLNADSKIEFPSKFNGVDRKVLLSGEAYFAVVHNSKQPFRVESSASGGSRQVVEDIGTEFNINAYADESSIRTTLVEGSASVNRTTLLPNQQAALHGTRLEVKQVDISQVIAWKEGLFAFETESLESIMHKVARWYDVDVQYDDIRVKKELFSGSVSRLSNVSALLSQLENTGPVKFKVTGRTVYVSANQ